MTVWLGKLSSYRRANRRNASSKRERERQASSLLLLLLGARNMKDFLRKRGKPLVLHARTWKSEIYSRLNAFIFAQKLFRFLSFLSATQGKEQDVSLFSQGRNSAQNIFEGIDEASIPERKRKKHKLNSQTLSVFLTALGGKEEGERGKIPIGKGMSVGGNVFGVWTAAAEREREGVIRRAWKYD